MTKIYKHPFHSTDLPAKLRNKIYTLLLCCLEAAAGVADASPGIYRFILHQHRYPSYQQLISL